LTLNISKAISLFPVVLFIIYVVFTTFQLRLHHFNLQKQIKFDVNLILQTQPAKQ
jgi:hypothetical protein